MGIPLTEKYRPSNLQNVLGNVEVISSLENLVKNGNLPHMLFYGPPGTGKTTTIRALALGIYGKHYQSSVLELNASDDRGIDTVRDTIKNFASTLSFSNTRKLIILDEADSMSRDAQNAMRRIIEDFSRNVRFCLIANYASKIIPAIHSRCTKFRFSPVSNNFIKEKIIEVLNLENVEYTNDGVEALVSLSDGDMRKVMNDIEGVISCYGKVEMNDVYSLGGMVSKTIFEEFFDFLLMEDFEELKKEAKRLKNVYSIDCECLVANLGEMCAKSDVKNKMKILKHLADLQYRLSLGCSDELQLNAMLSIFIKNR
ncbi:Subunit of heteropentameric Replication factor C (RF-C) [Gurleya vavrai]